jgi:aspartate-semialdehyde dehydrogenase
VIPFIKDEEAKSEQEPLKIWGTLHDGAIAKATAPVITAQCIRVPVSDGHMAAVSVAFERKPSREQILAAWREHRQALDLPSAPTPFLTYFEEDNRPQTRLDRDAGNGQGITIGRLRADPVFDWKFVALSHNTVRGAAGGAVLTAELLKHQGYLPDQV